MKKGCGDWGQHDYCFISFWHLWHKSATRPKAAWDITHTEWANPTREVMVSTCRWLHGVGVGSQTLSFSNTPRGLCMDCTTREGAITCFKQPQVVYVVHWGSVVGLDVVMFHGVIPPFSRLCCWGFFVLTGSPKCCHWCYFPHWLGVWALAGLLGRVVRRTFARCLFQHMSLSLVGYHKCSEYNAVPSGGDIQ